VILAFIAGFLGLGLGYVYVGKIRFGVATIVVLYFTVCFFAWTRLIVISATTLWLLTAFMILITLFALIHPIVLAAMNHQVPTRRYNRPWVYVLWSLGTIALGPIMYFSRFSFLGYETFSIPSSSMSPTVETGDFVLTDSWRYRAHPVAAGEIVIVERPESPGIKYIKRVVAVGGDQIEIRDGNLYRNGQQVAEPYVHTPSPYWASPRNVPLSTLGPNLIYVLGDFRDNSQDSRQWGPFRTSSLRGRVQYIWLSVDHKKYRWERVGTSLVPH
jgi:signal peptidase I